MLIRAQGNVTYLRLPTRTQLLGATTLACFIVWTGFSSFKLIQRDAVLEAKNERIRKVQEAYSGLDGEIDSLRSRVLERAQRLEKRQRYLETVLGTDPVMVIEEGEAPAGEQGGGSQNEDREGRGATDTDSNNRSASLGSTVGTLLTGPQAQAATRPAEAHYFPADVKRAVLDRLDRLERAQAYHANQIIESANETIDEINRVIAKTTTPTDRLVELTLKHMAGTGKGGPAAGVGGPLIEDGAGLDGEAEDSPLRQAFHARQRLDVVRQALAGVPSAVPAAEYYISSRFGSRVDPFTKNRSTHYGLDLAGWPGTDILAAAPGKVVVARKKWPYGWMVEIDHGNGFRTRYGHMRRLHVEKGQTVTRKELIGEMGTSGRSTSSHLHFEVWFDGEPTDPEPFIKAADDVFQIQRRENG